MSDCAPTNHAQTPTLIADDSLHLSLRQSCKGLSFRFCRAAAAVPGLCPSNAGSGSLREGLVPSFEDISL